MKQGFRRHTPSLLILLAYSTEIVEEPPFFT